MFFRTCNGGQPPLHGKFIRASAYSMSPYININTETQELEGGLVLDMFDILAKSLHFDYELIMSYYYNAFYPNGTIGGSLGDVRKKLRILPQIRVIIAIEVSISCKHN